MRKYYILSVDSFIDTFSMLDAAGTFTFSLEMQNQSGIFNSIEPQDILMIYRKSPVSRINMYMEVIETGDARLRLKKLLEVSEGAGRPAIGLTNDIEQEILTEIDKQKYLEIRRLLVGGLSDSEIVQLDNRALNRLTKADNILLYGVPGVGKSHEIQKKYCDDATRIERVVFHPDYTYSDFVGQILPRVKDGQLEYIFTPGPFTRMLKKAWDNPDKEYFLVIEEINRGNAPAIFGEIFQLLDRKTEDSHQYAPSEYGESEYAISNYDVALEVFREPEHEIRIPSNLWVLATMNTADQNVFTLDTAFQRRWSMRHIKNDVPAAGHAKDKIEGSQIQWGAFALVINELVSDINEDMVSAEDKRLGAYFVKKSELAADKFPEKVLKYLWDDAFKMDREAVFDERFKSLDGVIEAYEEAAADKLESVLKPEVYNGMLNRMRQQTGTDNP